MIRWLSVAAAALLLALPAMAQKPMMPPPGAPGMPGAPGGPNAKAQQAMMAAMQLNSQLQQLRGKALADPALTKEREAFEAMVEAKMAKIDPASANWIATMRELSKQAEALKAKGDFKALEALAKSAEPTMKSLMGLQQQVMADAEVKTAVGALDEKVRNKMLELDPQLPHLENQLKALTMRLQQQMGPGGPGGPGGPRMPPPQPAAPASAPGK